MATSTPHPRTSFNLVWSNCFLFNYSLAIVTSAYTLQTISSEMFQDNFGLIDPAHRPPSLQDKKDFSDNIRHISAERLGELVRFLDVSCNVGDALCLRLILLFAHSPCTSRRTPPTSCRPASRKTSMGTSTLTLI